MGQWCNCIECIGDHPEPTERELAQAEWDVAEAELQRAHAFNVSDCYQRVLAARSRAMAAGIDVMSQLLG